MLKLIMHKSGQTRDGVEVVMTGQGPTTQLPDKAGIKRMLGNGAERVTIAWNSTQDWKKSPGLTVVSRSVRSAEQRAMQCGP